MDQSKTTGGMWARHIASGDRKYHAIRSVVYGGSTRTRCRGSWPTSDAIESHDDPPHSQRCGACSDMISAEGESPAVIQSLRDMLRDARAA